MEVRVIAGRHILRVDSRIDEADRRLAAFSQLLVDQRDVASPHGSSEACATVLVRQAGGLVSTSVEGEIRVRRYVRAIAKGCRTLVARVDHARQLLP